MSATHFVSTPVTERQLTVKKRRLRGFTLLELVVVIAVISILAYAAIERLQALQAEAERAAMESVVAVLNSALGIKLAEHIVKQDLTGLGVLEGSNPMDRLAQIPRNYLGEQSGVDPATLERGNWYFDTQSRTLVYLVRNRDRFSGGLGNPPRARFEIRLVYADRNGKRRTDQRTGTVEGIKMVAVEPYRWIQ